MLNRPKTTRFFAAICLPVLTSGGCSTMFSTGDLKDHPVQVYSGVQGFAKSYPANQGLEGFDGLYSFVLVSGFAANAIADTVALPITIPLTLADVFIPPEKRTNFALAR